MLSTSGVMGIVNGSLHVAFFAISLLSDISSSIVRSTPVGLLFYYNVVSHTIFGTSV